jgi:hypothetical protein
LEESFLVLRRTPAAVDEELDAVALGIACSPAQGTEERRIEPGDTRDRVVEDGRAVGDGTAGLAERSTVLTSGTAVVAAKTTVLAARDVDG